MMNNFNDIKLQIELVPGSSWFDNVRSRVSQYRWRKIREQVMVECDEKCAVCGAKAKDAHEVWSFNDSGEQNLERIEGLCRRCHQVKHIGLSIKRNRYKAALAHLMHVNKWPQEIAELYVEESLLLWQKRSKQQWLVNVDHLKHYGVEPEES